MTSTLERFLDKQGPRPSDPNACQIWQGKMHPWGYGTFYMSPEMSGQRGKRVNAHRAAYLLFVSDDIEGLHVDHLCRNRACVNPLHLEAVTVKENVLRGEGPPAQAARWTHCKNGHEFTPENTMRQSSGARRCAVCERERWTMDNAKRLSPNPPRIAQHGTNSKYAGGCRCDDCRKAHNTYHRDRRARLRREASV